MTDDSLTQPESPAADVVRLARKVLDTSVPAYYGYATASELAEHVLWLAAENDRLTAELAAARADADRDRGWADWAKQTIRALTRKAIDDADRDGGAS